MLINNMCVILVFDICQRGAGSPAPKATVRNWSCAAGTRLQPAGLPRASQLPPTCVRNRKTKHRAGERILCRSSKGERLEPLIQLQQLPQECVYRPVHKLSLPRL